MLSLSRSAFVAILFVLGVLLSIVRASAISDIALKYARVETELKRFFTTPKEMRHPEPVYDALKQLYTGWSDPLVQQNLPYYIWMVNGGGDSPVTAEEIRVTATEWACVGMIQNLFVSLTVQNRDRWLISDSFDGDRIDRLSLDIEDAILRQHEAALVEIAATYGLNDRSAEESYRRVFHQCIHAKLPGLVQTTPK